MKFITKTSVAAIALFAMTGSASALNCTTDTPVESTDVPDLLALVVG